MSRFLCLCFFVFLFGLSAQAKADTPTYTLQQAVEYALKANPGVEARLLAIDQAKMNVGVAQSYFWPNVNLVAGRNKLTNSGGIGSTDDISNINNSRGVRASLSLFAGFMHLNNLQKSFLSVDMEQARYRQAQLELIVNVQLQFLQLLKAREDMKIVQESKKRISTQLKAAKAFVAVDMAPYLNVLQNEVEMSNVNQQELRAINAIRNAEVVLNKYLGYAPNDRVDYVGQLNEFNGIVEYTEEEAINTSLYSRPDLIIAQKSVAVATKQSNMTAGNYLPKADLSYDRIHYDKEYRNGSYNVNDYTRSYWNIGLNFSWNVFDGGSTTFSYLGDRKNIASLRKQYEDTMFTARADVIRALLDIQTSRDLISASRKGVEAATESYAMADKRYKTQTGTITELLDAQLRLTQAEADYSQALMEYHGARARFFYNIGKENIGLE
jgi:outer membrane protein